MTDYGPEFAAQMARNSAPASDAQVHQLAMMAIQLRDHSELSSDPLPGTTYNNDTLWRAFHTNNIRVTCGLILSKKPYPTLHLQTAAPAEYIPGEGMTLFRINTTILNNKSWSHKQPKYTIQERPLRYMVGEEKPEKPVFRNPRYSTPDLERQSLGSGFATKRKFDKLSVVRTNKALTVERFSQLRLLLEAVVEVPAPHESED